VNRKDLFVKAPLELLEIPGLPPRLILLYSRLRLHAGRDGKCHPRHSTLADEISVKPRQLRNLLEQLRALRLIEWTRGRYFNSYRTLNPDRQWIAAQIGNGLPIEKMGILKEVLKRSKTVPASQ
jgi:hypothetical protein